MSGAWGFVSPPFTRVHIQNQCRKVEYAWTFKGCPVWRCVSSVYFNRDPQPMGGLVNFPSSRESNWEVSLFSYTPRW